MKIEYNENILDNIYSVIVNNNDEEIDELYNDMSKYQKKIIEEWKEDQSKFNDYSLSDLIFDFDREFVERVLELELDQYIEATNEANIINKRNGYTKDIKVIFQNKEMIINRPRARKEKGFNSIIIPKRTKVIKDLKDNIILLFSKNNSIDDIKEILKGMFGIDVSVGTISTLINTTTEEVIAWRNKPLKKCYLRINIDCTYITIRDEKYKGSHSIPVYIGVGTDLEGHKEIVGMYLGNEDENKNVIDKLSSKDIGESKVYWMNVFEDLKGRGLEKVLFVVSDGLKGIEDAINSTLKGARYQRCIVHLDRNLAKYIPEKERKEVLGDFKKTYIATSKEESNQSFEYFKEKYKDRKTMIKHAEEYYKYIEKLYDYPEAIRKYIYTNNIIESANSKIQRGLYGRGSLPNATSAINIIYCALIDLEKTWRSKKVANWNRISKELVAFFHNEIADYL